jgi:hypothetical protein
MALHSGVHGDNKDVTKYFPFWSTLDDFYINAVC